MLWLKGRTDSHTHQHLDPVAGAFCSLALACGTQHQRKGRGVYEKTQGPFRWWVVLQGSRGRSHVEAGTVLISDVLEESAWVFTQHTVRCAA